MADIDRKDIPDARLNGKEIKTGRLKKAGEYDYPGIEGPSFRWKMKQFFKGKNRAGKVFYGVVTTAATVLGYEEVAQLITPEQTGATSMEFFADLLTTHNILTALIALVGLVIGYVTGGRKVWNYVKPILGKVAEYTDRKSDGGSKITAQERQRIWDEAEVQAKRFWDKHARKWLFRILGIHDQRKYPESGK